MYLYNRKGMSLIEVLVALLFLGLITVPLMNLFLTGNIFTAKANHEVTALNIAQGILEEIKSIPANQMGIVQGSSHDTLTLESTASEEDDYYNGYLIATTGGAGAGQVRTIEDYAGSSRRVTVDSQWDNNPVGDDTTYLIFQADPSDANYQISVTDNADYLNLKTVTVTVYYQDGDQEKAISLTTEKFKR